MNALRRVVIFGATSAIAEQAARRLVAQGASLYCVGRDGDRLSALLEDLKVRAGESQKIDGTVADLLETGRHAQLYDAASSSLGGLDGVLVAHGSLPDQAACEASYEQTRREFDVNGLSVISLLTLAANRFQTQGAGVIAAISSVAGDRGRQSNYVYGAAKGMVSIFMDGLRNRLCRHDVDVVNIRPGFVDTPMTAEFDKSGPLWASADEVATGIVEAMRKGRGNVYLPWFWRWIMLIIRHIPDVIFRRMSL